MKNLRKIIAFFILIFVFGIIITAISVNTTLSKKSTLQEKVEIQKDSVYLLTSEKKSV